MRNIAATAMAAGIAVSALTGAGTASAVEMSPQHTAAQAIPANHYEYFGPYSSFQECDDELAYVMAYPGFISSSGCYLTRGGNSWMFKALFKGNQT
jgi:hypothetical protein